jgi:hypothetical protein
MSLLFLVHRVIEIALGGLLRGIVVLPLDRLRTIVVLAQERLDPLGPVAADVVADDMDLAPLGLACHDVGQKRNELLARVSRTSPVAVFSAANRLSVPLRLCSKPWLSALSGDSASIQSLRSSSWIAVFSSTQNTAAWADGFNWSPITAAPCLRQIRRTAGLDA